MKKMISVLVLAVLMLTMVVSVASAASNPFGSKMITCAANAEVGLNNNPESANKAKNTGRLYVRHYLWGEWGGVYTNYFRAAKVQLGASTGNDFILLPIWELRGSIVNEPRFDPPELIPGQEDLPRILGGQGILVNAQTGKMIDPKDGSAKSRLANIITWEQ